MGTLHVTLESIRLSGVAAILNYRHIGEVLGSKRPTHATERQFNNLPGDIKLLDLPKDVAAYVQSCYLLGTNRASLSSMIIRFCQFQIC